jgi:two-component system, OmpR family, sensor kinase
MSVTPSLRPDPAAAGPAPRTGDAGWVRAHLLDGAVALVVAVNVGLMAAYPHEATVPFHLLWIAVLLLCGLRAWSHLHTDVVLAVVCVITTWVFWRLAAAGRIEAEEITEAPLMAVVFLVTSWHLRRRQQRVDAEREHSDAEQLAARRLGHDLRNPLTVARGYVDLIALRSPDPTICADAHLAMAELDRVATLARQLSTPLAPTAAHR